MKTTRTKRTPVQVEFDTVRNALEALGAASHERLVAVTGLHGIAVGHALYRLEKMNLATLGRSELWTLNDELAECA